MAEPVSERPVMDVRDLVANFPWDEVPDPPAGSGTMTDLDGRPMTDERDRPVVERPAPCPPTILTSQP